MEGLINNNNLQTQSNHSGVQFGGSSYGGETIRPNDASEDMSVRPWSYGGSSGSFLAPPSDQSTRQQLDEFEDVISRMASMAKCPPPYPVSSQVNMISTCKEDSVMQSVAVSTSHNPQVHQQSDSSTIGSVGGFSHHSHHAPPSYSESLMNPSSRALYTSPRPSPYPSPITSSATDTPPSSTPSSRRSSLCRGHHQMPTSPVRIHVTAPWEPRAKPLRQNA